MHDIVFDYYYLSIDREQRIYDVVYSIIMSIEEIKDLNLTEDEFKAGLYYASPERKKFVDVIALVQNLTYDLKKLTNETECRLCTIKDCDKCIDNDKFFAEEPTHSRKEGITSAVMTAKNLVYTDAIRTVRSVKIKFKSPYFSMSKIL